MSKTSNQEIILPNFLVIGAMRSGTTWLDKILRTNPNICLPQRRKEIHFFSEYYDRGIEWYQNFFPFSEHTSRYPCIGEISPDYLYYPEVPIRIKKHIPDCRFIVILRNPADRAYSSYGFFVKNYAEQRSFQEVLETNPNVFLKGLYGQQLERYLQHFPLENFLILIYEHDILNPEKALNKIAKFLDVDVNNFNKYKINQRINSSGNVRFPRARNLARKFRDFLRNKDLDWLWNAAKNSGIEAVFNAKGRDLPPIEPNLRAELIVKYESDITVLEKLISMDLSIWKKSL